MSKGELFVIRDWMLLDATLKHLAALVAFDTRNPPRAIGTDGIFDYLRAQLPGFAFTLTDHGSGAVSLYARRGNPKLLFNVHLDTVPDSPAWTRDPHVLAVDADHATGLGACDIKGAAAGLLSAANTTTGDMAMLFTTDEEANDPRCVTAFLAACEAGAVPKPEAVIVAEPTRSKAVLAHRGIQSVLMKFAGHVGHASAKQKPGDSALHQVVRWGNAALDYVESQAAAKFGGLRGLRFNIGRIEGGIKANMIAPAAELRFNMRPLPSMDPDALLATFRGFASEVAPAHFEETFRGPSLPAGPAERTEARRIQAEMLAEELGITVGAAVDFWTEAALFSAAGYPAFVFGPGDIAQAHAADEWVDLAQLQQHAETIQGIVNRGLA